MIIDKIVEPYFGENMYILIDEGTKKCAVVDPGGASDKILTYLKKNSLELEYILLTHGHGDHIGAVNYIKSKTNATIVAHSDEKELLNDNRKNLSYSMHCGPQELNADVYVNDKDKLELGNLKLSFIHTPGHTKGSMCYEFVGKGKRILFTGDFLQAGEEDGSVRMGIRVDPGYSFKEYLSSVKRMMNVESKAVLPGHFRPYLKPAFGLMQAAYRELLVNREKYKN